MSGFELNRVAEGLAVCVPQELGPVKLVDEVQQADGEERGDDVQEVGANLPFHFYESDSSKVWVPGPTRLTDCAWGGCGGGDDREPGTHRRCPAEPAPGESAPREEGVHKERHEESEKAHPGASCSLCHLVLQELQETEKAKEGHEGEGGMLERVRLESFHWLSRTCDRRW